MGVGVSGRSLEISGATPLRHRLQTRAGRTERIRSGSARPLGSIVSGCGSRSEAPRRQRTNSPTDCAGTVSNYEPDSVCPICDELEKLSGKKYVSTIPKHGSAGENEQAKIDIAFRVIAQHIRAPSFAIAAGIIPSTEGRG